MGSEILGIKTFETGYRSSMAQGLDSQLLWTFPIQLKEKMFSSFLVAV